MSRRVFYGSDDDTERFLSLLFSGLANSDRVRQQRETEDEKLKRILIAYAEEIEVQNLSSFHSAVTNLHSYFEACEKKEQFCEMLVKCTLVPCFVTSLKKLYEKGIFNFEDTCDSCHKLLQICSSGSFVHSQFTEELSKGGICEIMGQIISNSTWLQQWNQKENIKKIFKVSLIILSNLIRLERNVNYFKSWNLLEVFKKALFSILQSNDQLFCTLSTLVVCRLTKDNEHHLLDSCQKMISAFIAVVNDIINKNSVVSSYQLRDIDLSCSLLEVLEGLFFLSFNISIKVSLMNQNIIPLLTKILQKNTNQEELYFTCKILHNLVQMEILKERILSDRIIISQLHNVKSQATAKVNSEAERVLKLLEPGPKPATKKVEPHDYNDGIRVTSGRPVPAPRPASRSRTDDGIRVTENKTSQSESQSKKPLDKWDNSDVKQWLTNASLSELTQKFSKADGKILTKLHDLQKHAPELFYQTLNSSYELTGNSLLTFMVAFDDLNFK